MCIFAKNNPSSLITHTFFVMSYLASKPRYEILDGLRGVAAMMVVAFHLFETYSKGPTEQIINHGYLAVDFFFCFPAM